MKKLIFLIISWLLTIGTTNATTLYFDSGTWIDDDHTQIQFTGSDGTIFTISQGWAWVPTHSNSLSTMYLGIAPVPDRHHKSLIGTLAYQTYIETSKNINFMGLSYVLGMDKYTPEYGVMVNNFTKKIFNGIPIIATDIPTLSGGFYFGYIALDNTSRNWVPDASWNFTNFQFNGNLPTGPEFAITRIDYDTAPVPEPATILLLGIGLSGIAAMSGKNKKIF